MPPKQKSLSTKDLLQGVAAGLRQAAVRPNVYGYKPGPKQLEFHTSPARGRQFIGGNRSGKTVGGAVEAVWWLTGKHPYIKTPLTPVRGRCVSVDFLNGVEKIVRPEIARWLPSSELKGGSWYTAYNRELKVLTLENDSTLEFMSWEQDLEKFAGTSREFVWFDEEPPRDIFIECKMRLLDVGGSWWMTMTPVEGMTWTYDEIYIAARTDPNIKIVTVNVHENPHVSAQEIEATLAGLTEDERKARIEGKYVSLGGLIYRGFSPKNIIEPMLPPKEWLWVASMDHGYNNPTAWLWAGIDDDGRIFVFDEHYESGKIVAYHAQKVREINARHGQEPAYAVGDPSIRNTDPITGTSIQLEYIEHGIPIVPGNNDVHSGINRVARYIEGIGGTPKLYITRNCVNLLYEIQRYRWGLWAHKRSQFDKNKKEEPHKKDDHACDALRYLVSSRPEIDRGEEIPEFYVPPGAIEPVDPYSERIDTELVGTPTGAQQTIDFHLGGEW